MTTSDHDYQVESFVCPSCESENAKIITHLLDIPYYDDFVMVNTNCPDCGYRTSDFLNARIKDHMNYTYKVLSVADGVTKIVRSTFATVSLPELGVKIEPVSGGLSWIRNIEGVLEDVKERLYIALKHAENKEEKRTIKQRLEKLKRMMKFEIPFTISIDDPSGNSVILPANEDQLKIELIEVHEENE